jgi:hypothetical protein
VDSSKTFFLTDYDTINTIEEKIKKNHTLLDSQRSNMNHYFDEGDRENARYWSNEIDSTIDRIKELERKKSELKSFVYEGNVYEREFYTFDGMDYNYTFDVTNSEMDFSDVLEQYNGKKVKITVEVVE